ncbi:reverse transcriptase domain-containing protein, partial [Tanacetum coccineum]
MSTYLDGSRRQSYHSSCRDTDSCYQSSRSRGTEPASKKHHNKRASSHSIRGHSKSRRSPQDLLGSSKSETLGYANMVPLFNSTLTGNARVWFDDLPAESVNSYDDLKKAFQENYLQQK